MLSLLSIPIVEFDAQHGVSAVRSYTINPEKIVWFAEYPTDPESDLADADVEDGEHTSELAPYQVELWLEGYNETLHVQLSHKQFVAALNKAIGARETRIL